MQNVDWFWACTKEDINTGLSQREVGASAVISIVLIPNQITSSTEWYKVFYREKEISEGSPAQKT